MAEMMIREAIAKTLHDEMLRDENVVVLGEDIVGGMAVSYTHLTLPTIYSV